MNVQKFGRDVKFKCFARSIITPSQSVIAVQFWWVMPSWQCSQWLNLTYSTSNLGFMCSTTDLVHLGTQCFRDGPWPHMGPKFNASEFHENQTGDTWDVVGCCRMWVMDVELTKLASQWPKVGPIKVESENWDKLTNKNWKVPNFLSL